MKENSASGSPARINSYKVQKQFFEAMAYSFDVPVAYFLETWLKCSKGLRITAVKQADIDRMYRNNRIKEAFTGDNFEELAYFFCLSVRQIRHIVKDEIKKKPFSFLKSKSRPVGKH